MTYDHCPGRDLGSFGHEERHALTLVDWDIDFLNYDWCLLAAVLMASHHQDGWGRTATQTQPVPDTDVWARPLSDGET